MYLLKPISKSRIWGTDRLYEFGGDTNIESIGSVYTLTANPDFSNEILNGPNKGKLLYEIIRKSPEKFGLKSDENYPLIISFTGADKDLSIQVHPTDEYAKQHENSLIGKSESWMFIDGPSSGWIYAGSKKHDKEQIKEDMLQGKFDEVVDKRTVQKNDLVYIPSGTLHALTKGSLVYEIQQSTDITYRFYDYDRLDDQGNKRELHLEKAIDTLESNQDIKKVEFEENVPYEEEPYTIQQIKLRDDFINELEVSIAITNLGTDVMVGDLEWKKGYTIILLPDETLQVNDSTDVMIAEPNFYWRD